MSPFSPLEDIIQSIDGASITLQDISNYASNSSGVTDNSIISRQITAYDPIGTILGTGSQSQDSLLLFPFNAPIVTDLFVRFHLVFTNSDTTVYTADVKYLSTRFYDNIQKILASYIRTNDFINSNVLNLMNKATQLYQAALDCFITGDDVNADINIKNAVIVINQAYLLC